jgi:hypothetical protein
MRVVPFIALLLLVLALAGCGSAPYNDTADRAAIKDVVRSAWQAEFAGDESTACLYFTHGFIDAQNRVWEARAPEARPHQETCATGPSGYHPYLRLTNAQSDFGNDRVRFASTLIAHKSGTATVQPILPDGVRCLDPADCHVVISLLIHLVDQKGSWLIDDLDASACEVHGSCVPLDNQNQKVM